MNTQRPGPLFKHQATGTAWERAPLPRRGIGRLTLLAAAALFAFGMALRAMGGG